MCNGHRFCCSRAFESLLKASEGLLTAFESLLKVSRSLLRDFESLLRESESLLRAFESLLRASESLLMAFGSPLRASTSLLIAFESLLKLLFGTAPAEPNSAEPCVPNPPKSHARPGTVDPCTAFLADGRSCQ